MPRWTEIIDMPGGGHAFVCHSGPRPKRRPCGVCRSPADLQCDHPRLHGGTCDKYLCRRCAVPKGANVDWCPTHP
jgi:hypothetical protein